MKLFKVIKEKTETKRQKAISRRAEELITLTDFNSHVYIAYNGVPLLYIDDSWSSTDAIKKLKELRENYYNVKMDEYYRLGRIYDLK